MKKIIKPLILLLIIFLFIYLAKFNKTLVNILKGEPNPNKIVLIGVIRDSGLRQEEVNILLIPQLKYQIADLKDKNFKFKDIEFNGAYLNESNLEIAKNVGKCVEITGIVPETSNLISNDYTANGQYTYNRIVLNPTKLKVLNNKYCNVYTFNESDLNNLKKVNLEGKITRFSRPAPDIGYDYQIILKEPFVDNTNASGLPQTVNSYLIVPKSDEVWKKIEDNIKRDRNNIKLEGYENWGYAESKYILVDSIK
jgi:hypothetical protein